ncbi:MAG: Sec-independent protein translocase protein TatB [Burkholderiales bacterium]
MFDVGFSELMMIAVVALIVIGPERLPKVARTMGHLFGRLQRYVNDVKADLQREMELEELRKFKSTVEDAARSVGNTVHGEVAKTESELNSLVQLDAAPEASAVAPAAIPETAADGAASQLDLGLESKSDSAPGAPQQKTPA